MTEQVRKQILARAARNVRRRDKIMTDVNVEEGVTAERDSAGYLVGKDSLTFTTPKDSTLDGAVAGNQSEHEFTYTIVENDEQANKVLTDKEWNLVELVNRKLKADARAAVYQRELNRHKPITLNVPVEDVKERMAKDFMRIFASMNAPITFEQAMVKVEETLTQ